MADAAANWTRHLKDLAFEDLERIHDDLYALTRHPGWDRLVGVIEQERQMLDARLDHGDEPHGRAKYALLHGQRAGLAAPEAVVAAVRASYEERRVALEQSAGADGR